MNKQKMTLSFAAVAALTLGVMGVAIAEARPDNDDLAEATALRASTVSLTQAIAAAEAETKAKAIAAEFEDEDGTWLFTVELLDANGGELEVHIDPETAAVLSVEREDRDSKREAE